MSLLDNDITVDSRPYVIELQGYLRTIQRVRQGSTTVPQDGYYGPATADGVRQFQAEEGLPPTGRVDAATWDALYRVYTAITAAAQPPTPIVGKGSTPLVEGDVGDPVLFLNAMIGRLARVYNNILYTPPDPRYTPATTYAVRGIQKWAGLPVTGTTDTATWDIIATLYNNIPPEALFE
jgi:peptidoglycan hydrolase-like protein with peptidoglycan-binding domain